jgi:NAD(P)-dependent dehydrogenase (short-subunit alcohol dehydrogenase family)
MSDLTGQVAVVTGASRGIGLAVATALEGLGAKVVRASRSLAPAESANRLDIRCDITDPEQVAELAHRTRSVFGVPAAVVESAGVFMLAPLDRTPPADFTAQLATNLAGPFLVARAYLPMMKQGGGGRFITLGSIADHRAFPENAAYAASKFGLRGLHQVLREEYRGSGVLCTLVSPGPTDTNAWDFMDPDRREGFIPRSRMLRPEDVAEAVVWVAGRPAHVDVDWLRLGPA